ncbi:MAG TPA: PAS domain-containing protein [Pseudonocardia sp.]|nr:PAS domain-containing protein [Pseudonocardia sp.]
MPDDSSWSQAHLPTLEAIARLLHPHAEVVLHDLERDEIIAIVNPFSGRRVGDPSLLSELPRTEPGRRVVGPYEKVTTEGRRLTSVSSVVCDGDGKPRGLVCVNLDRSPVDDLVRAVEALTGPPVVPRPDALFERDWREQIALMADQWCRDRGLRREGLSRVQRVELVTALDEADLFATRHAAQHVARALGVSRATVYSLLQESRRSRTTGG